MYRWIAKNGGHLLWKKNFKKGQRQNIRGKGSYIRYCVEIKKQLWAPKRSLRMTEPSWSSAPTYRLALPRYSGYKKDAFSDHTVILENFNLKELHFPIFGEFCDINHVKYMATRLEALLACLPLFVPSGWSSQVDSSWSTPHCYFRNL